MNYDKVKDSGQRQKFTSGAVRDIQKGKGRFDLISPIALKRLAKHYENGAEKYGDNNWQKGIPIKRFLESALRHLNSYLEGDRSEDHIIACAWNCFAAAHTENIIFNKLMSSDLALTQCFIAEKDMDEITKKWWKEMKNIKALKIKKKKFNDTDEMLKNLD